MFLRFKYRTCSHRAPDTAPPSIGQLGPGESFANEVGEGGRGCLEFEASWVVPSSQRGEGEGLKRRVGRGHALTHASNTEALLGSALQSGHL